jgi:protein N-terminal methyltransferase
MSDETKDQDASEGTHVGRDKPTAPQNLGAQSGPDSRIDVTAAISYWSSIPATDAGVLGGHPQINSADLRGSYLFVARLLRQTSTPLSRVVDCGAGIGRVTRGVLRKIATTVDIVEPIRAFTDHIKDEPYVGKIFNVGLEQWDVGEAGVYDMVWHQWCICQLPDTQVVDYLIRVQTALVPGGWIVIKENLVGREAEGDAYDHTDNTVTRSDRKFRNLFKQAKLEVVRGELQRGMPRNLYRIVMYALQPASHAC